LWFKCSFSLKRDEKKDWQNYLWVPLSKEEFVAVQVQFKSQIPKFSSSAMIRKGNPYIVFEYGRTICLSEAFGSGETLGDKLVVGDVLTVVLTDKSQDQLFVFSVSNLTVDFSLDDVIVYLFTYTNEMWQIYGFLQAL